MYADEGFQVTCLKPLSGNEEIKRLKKEKGRDLTDPEVMGIDLIKVVHLYLFSKLLHGVFRLATLIVIDHNQCQVFLQRN